MYRVVPYLLVAAPLVIVLLSVAIGGCTRIGGDRAEQARLSDPDNRAGKQLVNELERRDNRAALRRIIDEAQR